MNKESLTERQCENSSRFVGVKGITKAPAQVWHRDLMCQFNGSDDEK